MNKLTASFLAILFLGSSHAADRSFATNASNSYCNRDYFFSGEEFLVHEEPVNSSHIVSKIKPEAGRRIEFGQYDSRTVSTLPGEGQFKKEPDYAVTTYYGDVDFIDFSKTSHSRMTEELKLKEGDKFEYLAHAEEEFGLIRVDGLVFMADLSNADIWSEPQSEWWVKIVEPEQGWIHLSEGTFTSSKCKW